MNKDLGLQDANTRDDSNETGEGWKMLNGHCVPVSTPDDYFQRSANQWLVNHRELVEAGRNLQQLNVELEHARTEYEVEL